MLKEDAERLCILSRSRSSSALHSCPTFSTKDHSHTVPITLYTNNDFALSPVTGLTLDFLLFTILYLFSLSGAQSRVFPIQTQWTRQDLYTNISPKPSYQTDKVAIGSYPNNKVKI